MRVSIYELKTKATKRLRARLARECIVRLSSGKKCKITKGRGTGCIELPKKRSEADNEEIILAQQLMGH